MIRIIVFGLLLIIILFYPFTFSLALSGAKKIDRLDACWLPLGVTGKAALPLPVSGALKKKLGAGKKSKIFKRRTLPGLIKKITARLKIRKLFIDLEVGSPNPAWAALLAGAGGASLGIISAVISANVKALPPPPYYQVRPLFGERKFDWRADCIFSLTCGDIIISLLAILSTIMRKESQKWLEKLKSKRS